MEKVKLLHNPNAGDEDHDKKELIALIESNGFECVYASVKKEGWDKSEPGIDLLAMAGGDGTVRRVAKKLLQGKLAEKPWPPLALLPLGTANNIATTLDLHDKDKADLIRSWQAGNRKAFDIGFLSGTGEHDFFLESFGYGIFPYLMTRKKEKSLPPDAPAADHVRAALERLHTLILEYEPRACKLKIDDKDHSGMYIMAEVMNTRLLGPNMGLAMNSDPGDGLLEVVLITAEDKGKFSAFILDKIHGVEATYDFKRIKGQQISISWDGTHVHADDEVVEIDKQKEVKISVGKGLLEFLVP